MDTEQDYTLEIIKRMTRLNISEARAIEFLDEERNLGARGVVQRFLGSRPLLESELERLSEKKMFGKQAISELSKVMRDYKLHQQEAMAYASY
jgi:hypothetical protein